MTHNNDVIQNTGSIALVTGASKGIGAVIAERLARDGFSIWLNYNRDHDASKKVQNTIVENGGSCTLLPFDVTDSAACKAALEPMLEQDTPYVLVNNAGFARDTVMAMMTENDWQSVLSVHLNGFFNVTSCVISKMMRKRKGRIINISSTAGQTGVAGQVNYSTAKSGIIGATRSLAIELAKRNVLVNAVAPGFIATDMITELPLSDIVPTIPQGRVGEPNEIAGVVSFLASNDASYMTGQVLGVNGGLFTG